MKLRYYLRGLGIGIIVTALLMGVVTREKLPLTDAEIKARARALGMVESDSRNLSDIQQPGSPSKSEDGSAGSGTPESGNPSEDGSAGSGPPEAGNPSEDGSAGSGPSEAGNPSKDGSAGSGTPEAGNPSEDGSAGSGTPEASESAEPQTVTVTVKSGYSSDKVSKLLMEAGLVEDAGEFDRYLVKSGYANRISVGTYEIEVGASMERIAKIITKSR